MEGKAAYLARGRGDKDAVMYQSPPPEIPLTPDAPLMPKPKWMAFPYIFAACNQKAKYRNQ